MWRFLLVLLSLNLSYGLNGKCRVLALGGGTDKGAYTAGGVIGLIQNLPEGEAEWDVITGTGDGAFNAYILAQYSKGDESAAASELQSFWEDFSHSDFYSDWAGWYVNGLLFQTGIYNSDNMYETVDNLGKGSLPRFLGVGATDLVTGGYVFFNNTNLTFDEMKIGVKASTSRAGIFPYIKHKDWRLVDGSIKFSVDVLHGVNACNQLGYTDDQIIMDVVVCNGKELKKIDASKYKTLQVLFRYLAITSYEGMMQVIQNVKDDHPDITMRTEIYPSKAIDDSYYPYDYTQAQLKAMVEEGIKDAQTALSKSIVTSK